MDHGDGRSPVPLTADTPVAETVADFPAAAPFLLRRGPIIFSFAPAVGRPLQEPGADGGPVTSKAPVEPAAIEIPAGDWTTRRTGRPYLIGRSQNPAGRGPARP